MEFTTSAIYGAIAIILLCRYLQRRSKSIAAAKSPPEAGGAWPILGHLHVMSDGPYPKLPHFTLGALAEKYGPAFTIRLGARRALVVSDWEVAKELYTKHDVAISSRPMVRANKHFGYDFVQFGVTPYGPYWREIRKLTKVELLSSRRIELMSHVRSSEFGHTMKELYRAWQDSKDPSGHLLVDMKQYIGELNLNIILSVLVGKRFYGDTPEANHCRRLMREVFYYSGLFVLADVLPYLGWLDFSGLEKKMKNCGKEIEALVGEWVDDHRRDPVNYSSKDFKPRDFTDVMLSLVDKTDFKADYNVDTIIKSTIMALMAGGTDTTSVMLVWSLSLLLNNRDVLKKAQEELDNKVGRERVVVESDINNLEYIQAIAKETFRLYPAGALAGPREFREDCMVGGYHIPNGTWLIVNLWKIQRDPTVWSDPMEFKPERFLTEHKDISVKGTHFELIPFGAGRRICPGADFGIQLLHFGLARFLQAFDFSTPSDELVDMTESAGLTNAKATPLNVVIKPRLPPHLY
ncbi:cytochrome P450 CYP82D47-like [Andrographis paniculata]|uniref:cytochrome P450 CYP82D47-like n=1 Tax=Andrographis paniculata TaxID=175694 RepID=UPI0021E85D39|nr:cytochrome P450 CYP82D47-like [Andrographis paniculata]